MISQNKPARLNDEILSLPTGRVLWAMFFRPDLSAGLDLQDIDPELRDWAQAAREAHRKAGGKATANELAVACEAATLGLRATLMPTLEMFRTYGRTHMDEAELRLACAHTARVSLVSNLTTLQTDVIARMESDGLDPETAIRSIVEERTAAVEQLAGPVEAEPDEPEPFVPFPVELLPEPIRDLVHAVTASVGCDEVFSALPAVIAASACIGAGVSVHAKRNWTTPPVLWGGIIGGPGSAKSPALNIVTAPARLIDAELRKAGTEAAKAYDMLDKEEQAATDPPERPRMHAKDTTLEALQDLLKDSPAGVLMNPGELAGWFESFTRYKGSSDRPHWLDLHSAGDLTLDRIGRANFSVPLAAAWVVGGIQPGILPTVLGSNDFTSGLAGRFLLVHPPERIIGWTDDELGDEVLANWEAFCRTLAVLRLHGTKRVIRLDDAAVKVFKRYANRNAAVIGAQTNDALEYSASKSKDLPLRLVPLLACGDLLSGDDLVGIPLPTTATMRAMYAVERVGPDVMRRAVALAEWFRDESMRVVAGIVGDDSAERTASDALMVFVRKRVEVSVRDAYTYYRPLRGSAERARAALDALVRAGRLERVPSANDPRYRVASGGDQ